MNNLRLEDLLNRHVDGALAADEQRELEQMLLGSPEARAAFWRVTRLHSQIRASYQSQAGRQLADVDAASCRVASVENGASLVVPASAGRRAAGQRSGQPAEAGTTNDACVEPLPVIVVSDAAPSAAWQGPIAWLSQIGPLSYSIATVLVGVAMLVASVVTVPRPTMTARRDAPSPSPVERPAAELVGRITGTMDCRWADTAPAATPRSRWAASTPWSPGCWKSAMTPGQGHPQGPCTYEIESPRGGFLSLGKLTARVETKGEGGGRKAEGADHRNSPFPLPPSPFIVRTPTAVVTDLGTEFGVEVRKDGATTSHVFLGRVALAAAGAGGEKQGREVLLDAEQSARVDKAVEGGEPTVTVDRGRSKPEGVVRALPLRSRPPGPITCRRCRLSAGWPSGWRRTWE